MRDGFGEGTLVKCIGLFGVWLEKRGCFSGQHLERKDLHTFANPTKRIKPLGFGLECSPNPMDGRVEREDKQQKNVYEREEIKTESNKFLCFSVCERLIRRAL